MLKILKTFNQNSNQKKFLKPDEANVEPLYLRVRLHQPLEGFFPGNEKFLRRSLKPVHANDDSGLFFFRVARHVCFTLLFCLYKYTYINVYFIDKIPF